VSEAEILQRTAPGLAALLGAFRYAQTSREDVWEFAVEIGTLRAAGVSHGDLRCLICMGYVEHAIEVTTLKSSTRMFRKLHNLALPEDTCLVLTAAGETVALKAAASDFRPVRNNNGNGNGHADPGDSECPIWDPARRELRVGNLLVKKFVVRAANQEAVLAAFEEEHWPYHIDDPLPQRNGRDPKQRLHDTIIKLHRGQVHRLMRFRGDGTGEGVCWELTGQSMS
jgi:hypothetical protein